MKVRAKFAEFSAQPWQLNEFGPVSIALVLDHFRPNPPNAPTCPLQIEAPKPTQNPEIPKKTARLRELFRKVRANFCPLPYDTSQEPDGNCSDKLVQMNFFILGGFFRVDFQ